MLPVFDIIVMGAGTAGLRFSIQAAKHGYSTALVENSLVGGTCLNTGCIPTKALLHAADLYRKVNNTSEFGVNVKNPGFDFKKVVGRSQKIVKYGRSHAEKSIKNIKKIKFFRGTAKFLSPDTAVVNNQRIKGKKILIATGAKPFIPPIKGIHDVKYWTNTEALTNTKLPKSLGIIGGGYIAVEFATLFSSFGCKVVILELLPQILSMLDKDVLDVVQASLKDNNVDVHTSMRVLEVKKKGKRNIITAQSMKSKSVRKFNVEKVLVATGRLPNTDNLNLKEAKVRTDKRGYITVNKLFQTSNKNIYAVGDVNGKALFSHAAKRQVNAAFENIFKKGKETVNFEIMPWAMFTFPPVSGVGLSEKQAREKGYKVGILKAEFSRVGKAAIIGETDGFAKIVFDKKTKKILGCAIVGPDADNLVHEIISVMNTRPSIESIKKTIHIHPTLAEIMENFREE